MKPRVKVGAGRMRTLLSSRALSRRTEIFVTWEISSSEISRMILSRRSSSPKERADESVIVSGPAPRFRARSVHARPHRRAAQELFRRKLSRAGAPRASRGVRAGRPPKPGSGDSRRGPAGGRGCAKARFELPPSDSIADARKLPPERASVPAPRPGRHPARSRSGSPARRPGPEDRDPSVKRPGFLGRRSWRGRSARPAPSRAIAAGGRDPRRAAPPDARGCPPKDELSLARTRWKRDSGPRDAVYEDGRPEPGAPHGISGPPDP